MRTLLSMEDYYTNINITDDFNSTLDMRENSAGDFNPKCRFKLSTFRLICFTIVYSIGALGNLIALTILHRSEKQMRNKKIILMLRCLVCNDLVALLGMVIQMHLHQVLPLEYACSHEACIVRVIWRQFGLSSGCVAVVMAVERWLALTHPFLYQKVSRLFI